MDIIERMLTVFGTIKNAHRVLGLEDTMTYANFYRAMNFYTVRAEDKVLIEEAWQRWLELFTRPEIPVHQQLTLTPESRATFPGWHPASSEPAAA
jgi:hypothetical protein